MEMQNNIIVFCCFIVICGSIGVTTGKQCKQGFIKRTAWQHGQPENICCQKVTENCRQGYYVEKCTSDFQADKCMPCPESKWLADKTNSDNVHPCIEYTCPSEAIRVNFLPATGCHKPCLCNTKKGWYGYDSCNCIFFTGKCPKSTKLSLNGTCLPDRIANDLSDLKPEKNAVDIPLTKSEEGKEINAKNVTGDMIEKTLTRNENITIETTSSTGAETLRIYITVTIVAAVIVIVISVTCTCCKRGKLCKGNTSIRNPKPVSSINLNKNISTPLNDSGISLENDSVSSNSQTCDKTETLIDAGESFMQPSNQLNAHNNPERKIAKVLPWNYANDTKNSSSHDQCGIPLIIQERTQDYLDVELGPGDPLSSF